MAYVAAPGHNGFPDAPPESFSVDPTAQGQSLYQHTTTSSMQDPNTAAFYHQNQPISCDIKPRLTKEQHDILEAHYKKQNKPNTNTKKGFADALNVPLDKVNNWFQNRRAKSKQDLKKQTEQSNFAVQHPPNGLSFSDSDTSPSFPSADYFSMMQHCPPDNQMPPGLVMPHGQQFEESSQHHALPYVDTNGSEAHNGIMSDQFPQEMFDSPLDMHRRTLTQEQFDAFVHNGTIVQTAEHFDALQHDFSGHEEVLRQMFPEAHQDDFKQHVDFGFSAPIGEPLSSNDSSISELSDHSVFPSNGMQEQATVSAPNSDFSGSRSSSHSNVQDHEGQYIQSSAPPAQAIAMTSQWQPGQSIPVDPNVLHQHFREVEQRQMQQQQQQQEQHPQQEQPITWSEDAYVRRDSHSGAMLAQQMRSFGIETPQPPQSATFKPAPAPASIATRRQRPRPANLGLASLRSQSYSGSMQPGSPGHIQQGSLTAGLPLRRIRSSNVINGVTAGRVGKPLPGSAQRSPLNYTFADGTQSPKIVRHVSSASAGNLAPPTPLSPGEADQQQQAPSRPPLPSWQSSSSQVSCQPSISETDSEHTLALDLSSSVPAHQSFSSPPHTPSYHQLSQPQFLPPRPIGNGILENTPPQSAPASQQTFFIPPQVSQPQAPPPPAQPQPTQVPQYHLVPSQPQHLVSAPGAEHYQPVAHFAPEQHFVVPTTPSVPQGVEYQFANGVPMINDQGQLTMAFPQQVAPVPPMHFAPHVIPHGHGQLQQNQPTPPMTQYSFVPADGGLQQTQMPKLSQPSELFVHEYSPPQDVKRAAVPRKTVDTGPKNYTFANHGPEHFEKDKGKKGADGKASSNSSESPVSA